jgi:serine/threonine-protein kinase
MDTTNVPSEPTREAYDLFAQWLDLDTTARAALLERVRKQRPLTHARMIELIDADNDATRLKFMAASAIADAGSASSLADADLDCSGQRIGNWELERSLGAGGMGHVWLAVRCDGLHQGYAAIKMLRVVVADARANNRFAQEGQILARLVHPNIAMLLDAGFSADGQRYLVLEYVAGERIDRWCDEHRLDLPARLKLFLQVCAAVAYAHANLIVHRDLKPSNILVLADGTAKLLDFGIAKLIQAEAGAAAQLTGEAGTVMTPGYAAPEQISGDAITTATDVYALGVILYGLLSGISPYGQNNLTPVQLARAVMETEPKRLSDAVDSIAAGDFAATRNTSPERLRRSLQGDLNVIAAKALKKNPAERYASVQALADDVRRHLDHRPIAARADSGIYRLRKFVRRHWFGAGAAALLVLAVAGGVGGTLAKQREAEHEAQRAIAVKRYLLDMFAQARTAVQSGGLQVREATVNDMLAAGADRIDKSFAAQPEIRDEVFEVLEGLYSDAFDPKQAVELSRRRLRAAQGAFGPEDMRSAPAEIGLASSLIIAGDIPAAEKLLTHAQTLLNEAGDNTSLIRARLLRWQGIIVLINGAKPPWHENPLRQSVELLRARYADDDELLDTLVSLPAEACRYGQIDEAIGSADELYRRTVARYGADNLYTDAANLIHGQLLVAGGHAADGLPALEHALEGYRRHVGEKNQNVLLTQLELSEAYWMVGRKDESQRMFANVEEAAARDHAGEAAVEAMLKKTRENLVKLHAGEAIHPCTH